MAFIERKHVERVVAVRQHHVGCIGEADAKVGILTYYPPCLCYVPDRELRGQRGMAASREGKISK